MKNKIAITAGIAAAMFFLPSAVLAQQYNIMEAIPGFFDAGSSISFPDLVLGIYRFGLWTVGIAALFMVTIGGFMYATSAGNTSYAGTAKKVITDALLGLVVAMVAYLGLRFINPDLVVLNSLTGGVVLTQPAGIPSVPKTAETAAMIQSMGLEELAKKILSNTNIQWDGNADCKDAAGKPVTPRRNIEELSRKEPMTICNASCRTSACTGSGTPPKEMLEAMLNVARTKKYTITSISGGQHGKNSSDHYKPGALDIVPSGGDWNSYVTDFINNNSFPRQTFCEDPGPPVKNSTSCKIKHHIHISFINR